MNKREMIEKAARLAHEANRIYCQQLGEETTTHECWESAPEWQRLSSINGVERILDNPTMTPEQCHSNWMERKLEEGWRHGPAKDPQKKEHPCLVPFSQLPVTQRFKDYLFQAVVRASLISE